MSTAFESAKLILKLYDLRREETMRKARNWFVREFFPTSAQDIMNEVAGPNSAYLRMVTSYWEMAASLVVNGAIDQKMFADANGEHVVVFAKLQPFLADLRATGNPKSLAHLEQVVMSQPDAEPSLERIRTMLKSLQPSEGADSAKA
jgi:hypothetical protein